MHDDLPSATILTEPPPLAAAHRSGAEHSSVPVHYSSSAKWVVSIVALILVVGLVAVYIRGQQSRRDAEAQLSGDVKESADTPTAIDVVTIQPAPASSTLSLPGEARSFYETTIFARTSGYLSKWLVDIGDPVKEGATLALIETPELDDQMVAARAKLDSLKAEVHVAQTTTDFAKVSFDRWEAAAPNGAVSHQERDQKKAELDASLARLEAAKSQVALGQAEVQRLSTLIGFKKVTAPFDGYVTQRHVDVGALVTAGSTTNTTPLFSISQSNQIRVFVDVPQPMIPFVKVGMEVAAAAREYPGRKFIGKVDRTAESLDPISKSLRVQVLVPNPDHTLLPGMYVQVAFQNTRATPPLRVPAGALCFRTGGPQVAVVTADHRVQFHDVTISRDMGDFVEIDSGLQANDSVALNVGNGINNGDLITPHAQEPAADGVAVKPPVTAAANEPKVR